MRILLAALGALALLGGVTGCGRSTTPAPAPTTAAPAPAPTATAPAPTAPAPTAPPATAPSGAAPPATTPSAPASLTMYGDSLSVLITPALTQALPGWTVSVDGLGGRKLAQGLARWRRNRSRFSTVLAFSLFTNDRPGDVGELRSAVQEVLAGANADCVLWGSIARPPLDGASWAGADALLDRLAAASGGRLVIVPWDRVAAERPDLLGPDRIHPNPAGVSVLAGLYADAARRCAARS